MDNKEFPEQEELFPPEQERVEPDSPEELLPEPETDAPSYEEDALPDADLVLMDTATRCDQPLQEQPEEPPMSDEDFQAFLAANAVPAEDASAPEEPVAEEAPAEEAHAPVVFELPEEPAAEEAPAEEAPAPAVFELPEEPVAEETTEALPEEDPLAPECEEEPDPLERELREAEELLREKEPDDARFRETGEDAEEFGKLMEPETKPEKKTSGKERPARKGRPRRKKGEGLLGIPNILVTAVWLAVIVVVGVTLGRMLWVCAADVLAFGREDRPVTVTIYESDTIDDITEKLHSADLIRYPGLFKLYASFAVDEGEIRPGIWDLNTRYDYHALVSMMSPSSSRSVVEVMIPEGYSCAQIFQLLEENKVCTAQDLSSYAASGELDYYWFLDGIARGEENCLEGYLFPDTYQFYTNDSPRNVLQKMLDNFDYRLTDEMLQQLPALNEHISSMMRNDGRSQEYIDAHQLTLKEVVIIASMIEKETSSAEEGYTIASVIYNRLYNWGGQPAYLNIDATMVYALGGKTDLTAEDLRIEHPYNTYLNTGLTPGPISNPGLSSLKAALDPAESSYYYYVLDVSTGDHHFSKTYEEHQAFIASQGG